MWRQASSAADDPDEKPLPTMMKQRSERTVHGTGKNAMDMARLKAGKATVELLLFGAHVLTWKEGGEHLLFLSKTVRPNVLIAVLRLPLMHA